MSPKLAPIFRSGVLPADSAECPRDRLVCAIVFRDGSTILPDSTGPGWICEGTYRRLLRERARMVVLEER